MNRRRNVTGVVCMSALAIFLCTFKTGCGSGFLGLQDYQRDLLFGGIATALLLDQPVAPVDGSAGAPVPGPVGEQGVPGADGVAGDVGPAGPQGPAGSTGAEGPIGPAGSAGANGSPGAQGAAGPTFFDIFIDDFFTTAFNPIGQLPVGVVNIEEPILGGGNLARGDFTNAIAYRVSIPDGYKGSNDVTMRILFNQSAPSQQSFESCFIFSVTGKRLRAGGSIEAYGDPLWLSVDEPTVGPTSNKLLDGILGGREGKLIVVDIPINSPAGLDGNPALSSQDFMAFELQTLLNSGSEYQILGVEFFESESTAALSGAVKANPCDAGKGGMVAVCPIGDCNNNSVDDACDLFAGSGTDCNNNKVLDECEDCNANLIPDVCDMACQSQACISCFERIFSQGNEGIICAEDCNDNGVLDECETLGTVCPSIDMVFLLDTSGSMVDEIDSLCATIGTIVADLATQGVALNADILAIDFVDHFPSDANNPADNSEFFDWSCLVSGDTVGNQGWNVGSSSGLDADGCQGDLDGENNSERDENWGPATARVADRYPWGQDSVRLIIPISDEGACLGGSGCKLDDESSVANAIVQALNQFPPVVVSPIVGNRPDECVIAQAQTMANGTGGVAVVADGADRVSELSNAINAIIESRCSPCMEIPK